MKKSLYILSIWGIFSYLHSTELENSFHTCILTLPIPKKKSQQIFPTITFQTYAGTTYLAEDVIKQLAIGTHIRDHLCNNWPHLPLSYRLEHFLRKQEDYDVQKGVVEKAREAARELIALFTPHITSNKTTITITINIEALKNLTSETRKQTYASVALITGKEFNPRKESWHATLKKLRQ